MAKPKFREFERVRENVETDIEKWTATTKPLERGKEYSTRAEDSYGAGPLSVAKKVLSNHEKEKSSRDS